MKANNRLKWQLFVMFDLIQVADLMDCVKISNALLCINDGSDDLSTVTKHMHQSIASGLVTHFIETEIFIKIETMYEKVLQNGGLYSSLQINSSNNSNRHIRGRNITSLTLSDFSICTNVVELSFNLTEWHFIKSDRANSSAKQQN